MEPKATAVAPQTEVVHTQTGLTIKRNAKNRFIVVTCHYTADPGKRSTEWAAEARAGMSDAKWAKEYEIDYTAQFGEKIFQEISTYKDKIVCKPLEVTEGQRCWAGLDYGQRNPSSFHVYTFHDGIWYSVWELYEPCKSISQFATKIKNCPYYDRLKYIAADPDIWSGKTHDKYGNVASVQKLLAEEGIHKLIPGKGKNDEAAWIAMIKDHWRNPEGITFKIYESCWHQISEFERITYAGKQIDGFKEQNWKESMVDNDNHALDDCKYFMMTNPRGLAQPPSNYARMWERWKN